MNTATFFRLITLAAIWGGAFLFMKIGAPVLGPAILIEYRVGFGALFLASIAIFLKRPLDIKKNWKHYLILGFFNCAFPFFLYAFAAKSLSASMSSIINATSPIWGAVIAAIWTRQPMVPRAVIGLLLGLLGVCILVGFDKISLQPGANLAIAAMLGGAVSFGIAANYAKSAQSVSPFANSHGSLWAATLMLAPAIPFFPAPATPTVGVMAAVLMLGILCSGVAYLLYYRLVQDMGASALTVTFLIPVFGILWGRLFLGEVITWYTVAGTAIIIVGTALVTGFSHTALKALGVKQSV